MKNFIVCILALILGGISFSQGAMADSLATVPFRAPVQVLCSPTQPPKNQVECLMTKWQAQISADQEVISEINSQITAGQSNLQNERNLSKKLLPAGIGATIIGAGLIVLAVRNAPETLVARIFEGLGGSLALATGGAALAGDAGEHFFVIPKTKKNIAILQREVSLRRQELLVLQAQLNYAKSMLKRF